MKNFKKNKNKNIAKREKYLLYYFIYVYFEKNKVLVDFPDKILKFKKSRVRKYKKNREILGIYMSNKIYYQLKYFFYKYGQFIVIFQFISFSLTNNNKKRN